MSFKIIVAKPNIPPYSIIIGIVITTPAPNWVPGCSVDATGPSMRGNAKRSRNMPTKNTIGILAQV